MSVRSNLRAVRQAAEGFGVIVVGILVALAADEWMAGLNDSRKAAALTERLIADIRVDSLRIGLFIARALAGEAASARFLPELGGG